MSGLRTKIEDPALRIEGHRIPGKEGVAQNPLDTWLERLHDRLDIDGLDLADPERVERHEPALGPAVHRHHLNDRGIARDRDAELLREGGRDGAGRRAGVDDEPSAT